MRIETIDIRNRVEEEEDEYGGTTQTKKEKTSVEEKLEMRKSILQFVVGGVSALALIVLMQLEVCDCLLVIIP